MQARRVRRMVVAAAVALASRAGAADISSTWNVVGAGNWGIASNWSNSPATSNYPNNGNGGFTYDATLAHDSALLNVPITIQKLNLTGGTLLGPNSLTANLGGAWTVGKCSASVNLAGGTYTVSGAASKDLSGPGLTVQSGAIVNFSGGAIRLNGTSAPATGQINVLAGGSFNCNADGAMLASPFGFGTFTNAGTFSKNVGTTGTTVSSGWQFNNTGFVNLFSGDITLSGGGSASGSFYLSFDTNLFLPASYTLTNGASFSGDGTMYFTNTLATSGTVSLYNVDQSSGALSGTGTTSVGGYYSWSGGAMSGAGTTNIGFLGVLDCNGSSSRTLTGRTITIESLGAMWWSGPGSIVTNSATPAIIHNLDGGNFDIQSDGLVLTRAAVGNIGSFTNEGTITKSFGGGTATLTDSWSFSNTGLVEVQSGTLLVGNCAQIAGGTITGGSWQADAGATLALPGVSITTNQGSVTLSGASSSFPAIAALNQNLAPGAFTVTAGRTFTTAGSLANSGSLSVEAASGLVVGTGATLTNSGEIDNEGTLSAAALINSGALNQAAGTATFGAISSTGAVIVTGGTLRVSASGATGVCRLSTLSLVAPGTLDLTDNDLVVQTGSFTTIKSLVASGAITVTTSGSQVLALFDNALVNRSTWEGGTLAPTAVVGKYTYFGDVNLDGQVSGDDYTVIDSNLNSTPLPGIAWLKGDVNLDGTVSGDDYTTVDAHLGMGVGNPLVPSSIPEPALGSLMMATCLRLAVWGRRRRAQL